MTGRVAVAVGCASACAFGGVAYGSTGKTSPTPLSGTWKGEATVTVAKHISDAKVGDRFPFKWTITPSCSGSCEDLTYEVSSGHVTIPLHGHGKRWSGTLSNQVFSCTNGGTANGSLSFKLNITKFVKHHRERVAEALKGTGVQSGKGCATIKLVEKFQGSRSGF